MLVITIIVIIILAVAVILTLSNNNPIENAKTAVSANDETAKKEAATLAYSDWYLKEGAGQSTGVDAQKYVENELEKQGINTKGLIVSNDGTIITNAPIIPNGFKYIIGTVESGLVIKNTTDGNEFVWVPVEEGSFERESFSISWTLNTKEYKEPYSTTDYTEETTEYNKMVASVSKYGGFYIGRYEASKDAITNKAQSIANQKPWRWIKWGTSITNVSAGAVEKARAVYPDSDEKALGEAISILPYGVQWDATVRFIETNYPGISEDSTGYGNYGYYDESNNAISADIIDTGSNLEYALNNIYDMAGNVWEWTMEAYFSSRTYRGGNFQRTGSLYSVSSRNTYYPDVTWDNIGFRLALYIK